MNHGKSIRKFGRVRSQRTALLRSLAKSLIEHGKIKTTLAKAKEVRPFVEKLVTKGRTGDLAARRLIISRLGGDKTVGSKVVDDISKNFKDRSGGYTRITKLAPRGGDGGEMAIIEFV